MESLFKVSINKKESINKKVCARCGEELTLDNYSTHNTSKDGLQSWCNRCNRLYSMLMREYKDVGGVKYCKKCKRFVPKNLFYPSKTHKDGLQSYCQECDREHGKLRNGTTGEYREPGESHIPLQKILDVMLKMPLKYILDTLRKRGVKGRIQYEEDL